MAAQVEEHEAVARPEPADLRAEVPRAAPETVREQERRARSVDLDVQA